MFISFGSWVFSTYNAAREESRSREERIRKLDGEIQYRLTRTGVFASFRVLSEGEIKGAFSKKNREELKVFSNQLLSAPAKDKSLFPELAERGLLSLVKELELLLNETQEEKSFSNEVLQSSLTCASRAFSILLFIEEQRENELTTLEAARLHVVVAAATRWGGGRDVSWETTLKLNKITREDVENLLPDEYGGSENGCQSSTMKQFIKAAKEMNTAGNAIP